VRRDYLLEHTLGHWKRTHFFLLRINGESRETVSAVFHCLPSISKEQSLQVPKSKKDPKNIKKDQHSTLLPPKPIIKPFHEISQYFMKSAEMQKSVSWAGRRNVGPTKAGSATGKPGGRCGQSSTTHHGRCLKYCRSL